MFTSKLGTLDYANLKIHSLPDIPNPTRNRHLPIPFDVVQIRQRLESVLACEEQPLQSMSTVAKSLNYSPRELCEKFSELNRAISIRRENYYMTHREQVLQQLKCKVRQAALEIHSQGLYPSSEKVGSLLGNPAVMRDPNATRFWHEMLQELKKN